MVLKTHFNPKVQCYIKILVSSSNSDFNCGNGVEIVLTLVLEYLVSFLL